MKLQATAAVLTALTLSPAFAAPETYALDASHTYPRFSYSHFGFSKQLSRFNGDKPARVEGNLTIKGVTKPVTLSVTSFLAKPHPMLKKDALGANATAMIK